MLMLALSAKSEIRELMVRFDKNGDGLVSAEERQQAAEGRGQRLRDRMQGQGDDIAEAIDTDGDGNISREEYLAAPTPMADFADTDGDGGVTQEEFAAFVQAAKAKRK